MTDTDHSICPCYWNPKNMLTLKSELCYGEAFLSSACNGSNYVLRRYELSDENEEETEGQWLKLKTFKDLDHPSIARVLDMKKDDLLVSIAHEYHDTHLGLFLPHIDKSMVKRFLYQILDAIQHYHIVDLEHGDLRPQSILVYPDQEAIKIANYKLAFLTGHSKGNKEHSGCYRAPEILYSRPLNDRRPADMWAVGCIFAELVRGCPLFEGPSIVDSVDSIHRLLGQPREGLVIDGALCDFLEKFPKYPPKDLAQEFPDLDAAGIDLLTKLLNLDWNERITSVEAVTHPYLSGCVL